MNKEMTSTSDPETIKTIHAIAKRASQMAADHGNQYPLLDATMDIDSCHSNGCTLDLAGLLAADVADFAHDVFGINQNLDRTTGQLTGGFLPRYAAKTEPVPATYPVPACYLKEGRSISSQDRVGRYRTQCGKRRVSVTIDRTAVTCPNCIASLS